MTGPFGMGVLRPTGVTIPVPPTMWWDFSDSATVTTTSGRIDQVNDKGGGSRHLVGVTGNRPYTGRTVNGLAVADFQGDQYMRYISPGSNMNFPTGTYTIFIAGILDDGSSINSGILSVHNSGATSDWDNQNAFVIGNGTTIRWVEHSQAAFNIFEVAGSGVMPPGVYGVRHNTGVGARARYPFGSTSKALAGGIATGFAQGGILVGARYSTGIVGGSAGAQRWDGTIGEIIIYNSVLSDADMDAVYTYLTDKWGAFSPGTLPSFTGTIWGHWDPTIASSLHSTSGRVDQLDDLSGNGRHLVSTGSNRPYTGRSTPGGGLTVLDFQLGQYMRAVSSIGTSAYTIFFTVMEDRVAAINKGIWSLCPTGQSDWNNADGICYAVQSTAGGQSVFTANASNVFGTSHPAAGIPTTVGYRHNSTGTPPDLYYPTMPTVSRLYGGTAAQGLLIGTRWSSGAVSATDYWDGGIGEILLVSTAMSDADIVAVGDQMTYKWYD